MCLQIQNIHLKRFLIQSAFLLSKNGIQLFHLSKQFYNQIPSVQIPRNKMEFVIDNQNTFLF